MEILPADWPWRMLWSHKFLASVAEILHICKYIDLASVFSIGLHAKFDGLEAGCNPKAPSECASPSLRVCWSAGWLFLASDWIIHAIKTGVWATDISPNCRSSLYFGINPAAFMLTAQWCHPYTKHGGFSGDYPEIPAFLVPAGQVRMCKPSWVGQLHADRLCLPGLNPRLLVLFMWC